MLNLLKMEDLGKVGEFIIDNTKNLISTIITLFILFLILLITRIITKRFIKKNNGKRKHAVTLVKMIHSIIKYVVWILTVIIILGIWGIDITPILAGAGILALGISLGAQKLINDLICGFCIVFENQFDVDDVVEIDGFKGRVEEISLRSTKLINYKNEVKMINNGSIETVINYSKGPSLGIVDVDIAYEENIDHVLELLKNNLHIIREKYSQIIEGPNVVGVVDLANSGVTIRVNVKTLPEEHYEVERALKKFIKELFDKENIEIPFDQLVVRNAESNN